MSNKETIYWKDAKGKSIDVMSMDLNYCRNVLKMIITGKTQSGKSFNLNKHLEKQAHVKAANKFILHGDIANMFNNEEHYNEECDATKYDIY